MKTQPIVNNVEDKKSESDTVGASPSVDEEVNNINNKLEKHNLYDANYNFDCDELDDNCMALITDDHIEK